MTEKTFTHEQIAQLAASMTGVLVEALQDIGADGGSLHDLVFANLIALKGISLMQCGDEEEAVGQLRGVFAAAMKAQVVGKHFRDEEEMHAWLAEQGRNPDGSPAETAKGPVH